MTRHDLLTLRQAAELLGTVTATTLRVQVRRKRLHAVRLGHQWVVTHAEVERYRRESLGRPGRRHQATKKNSTTSSAMAMTNITA